MADELDTDQAANHRRLRDIVRSTLIVGGGSVVTVVCGVVRGKVISLAVGAAGIGLQGLLQAILRTASQTAAMSLSTSGVREVARLRGEGDQRELSHTLRALRMTTLAFGGLAAAIFVLFRRPLASALLDDADAGWMLGLVGLGTFSQVFYCFYDAFLRGFRRVALVTKGSIAANVLATALGSALVLKWGDDGIVWALVSQPIVVLAVVAFVGRDVGAHILARDPERERRAAVGLVRMGAVLTVTGFITTGVQLVARLLVKRFASLDDVGYFQAAWAISVLYLGFVLGSLSLDYFPRLAEMKGNRAALVQMVNEQAKMSFLLAGPAVLGLLTLSQPIVSLLYTTKFAATVVILRWQLLGDVLKIGSWTLSYLVLAQGAPRAYFVTELSWNVIYLGVIAALVPTLGVEATAVAYVAASAGYFAVLYVVSNRFAGFRWTRSNVALMTSITGLSALVLAGHLLVGGWWSVIGGAAVTAAFGAYCLHRLAREIGFAKLLRR